MFSFFADKNDFVNIGLQKDNVFFYEITDSTNKRAREIFSEKNPDSPMLFVANGQTSGKGTRGRSFESKSGKGLYFSLLLPGKYEKIDSALITPIAAAAAFKALSELLPESKREGLFIKWVNDIYAKNRKIAGILCEKAFFGENFGYIIGIGINLYGSDFSPEIKNIAGSVEELTGEVIDRAELLLSIISTLLSAFDNKDSLVEIYKSNSIPKETEITVSKAGAAPKNARVVGLNDSLMLTVEYENGETEALISGDVTVKFQ